MFDGVKTTLQLILRVSHTESSLTSIYYTMYEILLLDSVAVKVDVSKAHRPCPEYKFVPYEKNNE